MAKKRRVRVRRSQPEEEIIDDEVLDEELDDEELDDVDLEDEDDFEDEEEDEPAPRRQTRSMPKKSAPVKTPAPVAKKPVSKKVVEEVEDDEVEDGEDEPVQKKSGVIKTVNSQVAEAIVVQIFSALEDGDAVTFSRKGDKWTLTRGQATSTNKLKGKEFWLEVANPEYIEWVEEWRKKSLKEKIAYAKKIGAEWEDHETERVLEMRVGAAVREKEGIDKYKPEYMSRASRSAIRA